MYYVRAGQCKRLWGFSVYPLPCWPIRLPRQLQGIFFLHVSPTSHHTARIAELDGTLVLELQIVPLARLVGMPIQQVNYFLHFSMS